MELHKGCYTIGKVIAHGHTIYMEPEMPRGIGNDKGEISNDIDTNIPTLG